MSPDPGQGTCTENVLEASSAKSMGMGGGDGWGQPHTHRHLHLKVISVELEGKLGKGPLEEARRPQDQDQLQVCGEGCLGEMGCLGAQDQVLEGRSPRRDRLSGCPGLTWKRQAQVGDSARGICTDMGQQAGKRVAEGFM